MALLRLLALCLSGVMMVTSLRCCPDDEVMLTKGRHCSITEEHKGLNCTDGRYVLDPYRNPLDDKFQVLEDGRLKNGDNIVGEERYCLTRLVYRNGTATPDDVAFVCFANRDSDDSKPARHATIGTLLFISSFFLLIVVLVYSLLPEMRDLEGKCLLSYVGSLLVAFVVLATMQFDGGGGVKGVCELMGFFEYFWMMSAFFWLCVVSFNVWRSVRSHHSSCTDNQMFLRYSLCGWGCPLIFLIAALVAEYMPAHMDHIRPKIGYTSCWFHSYQETWIFFYGPIAVLLSCNIGFFISTVWTLWHNSREHTTNTLAALKFKCMLHMKLFVMMGITWIFEIISYLFDPSSSSVLWYATDILNALQGVLIFIITVVCRKRVLRGLSKHQTCWLPWPTKWAAGVDAESHVILQTDDVELPIANGGEKILS